MLLQVPADYQKFETKRRTSDSEDINRARIKERKETANLLQKTGLLREGKTLTIRDYEDDSKEKPGISNRTLLSYLEDEEVYVYDFKRMCIGKIKSRRFYWKHHYKGICDNAPTVTDN